MKWERIDLKNGLLYLDEVDQKNGQKGSIPINSEVRAAIIHRASIKAQHCPNSQWLFCHPNGSQIKSVRRSFKRACKKACIENYKIHDMRHTVAAWLVQSGTPIAQVSQLLRHSDIRMTMRYSYLSPDNLRSTTDTLAQISIK